jgi:UDP-GlcNAc:undecaprenyl-phosphate GlcNAc-1-phosphate transferase
VILLPLGATIAGCVVTAVALRWAPSFLNGERHAKENYRGRTVIATAGVVLIGPLAIGALAALLRREEGYRTAAVLLVAGVVMCVLGLVDDIYGSRRAGGLIGHVRELFRGSVTTGLVKAFGGGVVGLGSSWALGRRGVWFLVGGLVIALATNLANLFDLRPGRAIKIWFPLVLLLALVNVPGGGEPVIWGLGGGVAVFLVAELREQVMLGDAGANLLGAVAGTAAVATLGDTGLVVCAVVLAALTAVSEFASFSDVIEKVPPLRWLDHLGRAL